MYIYIYIIMYIYIRIQRTIGVASTPLYDCVSLDKFAQWFHRILWIFMWACLKTGVPSKNS